MLKGPDAAVGREQIDPRQWRLDRQAGEELQEAHHRQQAAGQLDLSLPALEAAFVPQEHEIVAIVSDLVGFRLPGALTGLPVRGIPVAVAG